MIGAIGARGGPELSVAHGALVLAVTLFVAARLLVLKTDVLWDRKRAPDRVPELADQMLAERVTGAMTQQRRYRAEGLTIGMLAESLGEQEYRLRRVINGTLGSRPLPTRRKHRADFEIGAITAFSARSPGPFSLKRIYVPVNNVPMIGYLDPLPPGKPRAHRRHHSAIAVARLALAARRQGNRAALPHDQARVLRARRSAVHAGLIPLDHPAGTDSTR